MAILPVAHHRMIADLHCDLLCYLSRDPKRSPYDLTARCSIPQLKEGGVKFQTLAIFTETGPGSSQSGLAQVRSFKDLLHHHSDTFELIRKSEQCEYLRQSNKIGILPAIENSSSFCEEGEVLEDAFHRLTTIQHKIGKLAYVSLTWNTENRFGGGAHTDIGLKTDGKRLIDYLCEHNIPLDFSHASDRLAFDILDYVDKNHLPLSVLASHSNFRAVADASRNLPKDLALEIFKRDGVIGLNFIRVFVGEESTHNFVKQLEYGISLGYPQHLCLGADFFYIDDVSLGNRKEAEQLFFPGLDHAGTYSYVCNLWTQAQSATSDQLNHLCYDNLIKFVSQKVL